MSSSVNEKKDEGPDPNKPDDKAHTPAETLKLIEDIIKSLDVDFQEAKKLFLDIYHTGEELYNWIQEELTNIKHRERSIEILLMNETDDITLEYETAHHDSVYFGRGDFFTGKALRPEMMILNPLLKKKEEGPKGTPAIFYVATKPGSLSGVSGAIRWKYVKKNSHGDTIETGYYYMGFYELRGGEWINPIQMAIKVTKGDKKESAYDFYKATENWGGKSQQVLPDDNDAELDLACSMVDHDHEFKVLGLEKEECKAKTFMVFTIANKK